MMWFCHTTEAGEDCTQVKSDNSNTLYHHDDPWCFYYLQSLFPYLVEIIPQVINVDMRQLAIHRYLEHVWVFLSLPHHQVHNIYHSCR